MAHTMRRRKDGLPKDGSPDVEFDSRSDQKKGNGQSKELTPESRGEILELHPKRIIQLKKYIKELY